MTLVSENREIGNPCKGETLMTTTILVCYFAEFVQDTVKIPLVNK